MVWESAPGEGTAAVFATKVKMSRAGDVCFPFSKTAATLLDLRGRPRAARQAPATSTRLGAVGPRWDEAGAGGWAAADAPGSGEAASAPPWCSWVALNRWGPEFSLGRPFLPGLIWEGFTCLTRGIKMILVLD